MSAAKLDNRSDGGAATPAALMQAADRAHEEEHMHEHYAHDHLHDHDHEHEGETGLAAGLIFFWVVALLFLASIHVCRTATRGLEIGRRLGRLH